MSDMVPIRYISGDATDPHGEDAAMIVHVCNDTGGWGAGFVVAILKRWREPEEAYRRWHRETNATHPSFALGEVQFVRVTPRITVANMIAQHGVRSTYNRLPVRYEAIDTALSKVGDEALRQGTSIHMPRIGCGLAGGTWERIEPLVRTNLSDHGLAVTVYDFTDSCPPHHHSLSSCRP